MRHYRAWEQAVLSIITIDPKVSHTIYLSLNSGCFAVNAPFLSLARTVIFSFIWLLPIIASVKAFDRETFSLLVFTAVAAVAGLLLGLLCTPADQLLCGVSSSAFNAGIL